MATLHAHYRHKSRRHSPTSGARVHHFKQCQNSLLLSKLKLYFPWQHLCFVYQEGWQELRQQFTKSWSSPQGLSAELGSDATCNILLQISKGSPEATYSTHELQFNSIILTLHSRFSNIWGPIVLGSEQSWNRPFLQQPCNMKDKIKWLKRENRWAVYQHVECRFLPKVHSSRHQSSSFTSTHPPEGVCTFAFISSRLTPINQLISFYSCLAIKLLQVTAALLTLIYSTSG